MVGWPSSGQPRPRFENPSDVAIPDLSTVELDHRDGVPGNAPATLGVGVDIRHTYHGDQHRSGTINVWSLQF